ncbi:unnamed protein product [Kluyveromyces dobzhanskii CBS 2104]|uniref:N-alpha-acetyltransferase 40 n=1 Tax=Kluyveromyces dobzhanskii CBS 2104 TaxID=1427455 RepID=A0A0A8L7N2_9SACH|nr:unnamed protein product [Kluyveromyces dobzhanskii CBS 2104]
MSNYHSRHLKRVAEKLCNSLNGTEGSEVEYRTFSNRTNFADPEYVDAILPSCLGIIKDTLGKFYEAHGSSIYHFDDDNGNWVQYKWGEMLEKDLVYIVFFERSAGGPPNGIVGFVSLALSDPLDPESAQLTDFGSSRPRLFLYEIHLRPEYQSRGIGSSVFDRLLVPMARDLACPSIEICVFTTNKVAMRWYQGLGFQLIVRYSDNFIGMGKPIVDN